MTQVKPYNSVFTDRGAASQSPVRGEAQIVTTGTATGL